jgi:hypothetical protein
MALRHVFACLLATPAALSALTSCGLAARLCTPTQGRPTAAVCTSTNGGSAASCKTSADCSAYETCLGGTCGLDACDSDGDCPSGNVCVCAGTFYGGNTLPRNHCIPAMCDVDADCGGGSICGPSIGYCGAFTGYHCTPANLGDCDRGDSCQFVEESGRFECKGQPTCSG